MEHAVTFYGTEAKAEIGISRAICNSWGMPLAQIAQRVGIRMGESFVLYEVAQRSRPANLTARLVVLTALRREGLGLPLPDTKPQQGHLSLPQAAVSIIDEYENMRAELKGFLITNGCTPSLANALFQNISVDNLCRMPGHNFVEVRRVIQQLPEALLDKLSDVGPWSSESWLVRERDRRAHSSHQKDCAG